MFSDLVLFIILSLYLWKKAKDYQNQDQWDFKSTLTVSAVLNTLALSSTGNLFYALILLHYWCLLF